MHKRNPSILVVVVVVVIAVVVVMGCLGIKSDDLWGNYRQQKKQNTQNQDNSVDTMLKPCRDTTY
jgi:flagellar basal body-associated protein FliL